jgi:hypothetical protein
LAQLVPDGQSLVAAAVVDKHNASGVSVTEPDPDNIRLQPLGLVVTRDDKAQPRGRANHPAMLPAWRSKHSRGLAAFGISTEIFNAMLQAGA